MARREVDEWFFQVGSELQRMNDDLFRSGASALRKSFWVPNVDITESPSCFVLKAELSGVRVENIQLLYVPERHSVLLRGNRREEDSLEMPRTGIHQLEIYYGEFEREINLPDVPVESVGIKASLRNGFLLVIVPKAEANRESVVGEAEDSS
jgi:HSP20 family protein